MLARARVAAGFWAALALPFVGLALAQPPGYSPVRSLTEPKLPLAPSSEENAPEQRTDDAEKDGLERALRLSAPRRHPLDASPLRRVVRAAQAPLGAPAGRAAEPDPFRPRSTLLHYPRRC